MAFENLSEGEVAGKSINYLKILGNKDVYRDLGDIFSYKDN